MKTKTVRELIAELQKLDQDRHIWQVYDFPFACTSASCEIVDERIAKAYREQGLNVQKGDYMFRCG